MAERERKLARRRLDEEMQTYRRAGIRKNPTNSYSLFPIPCSLLFYSTPSTFTITRFRRCPSNSA